MIENFNRRGFIKAALGAGALAMMQGRILAQAEKKSSSASAGPEAFRFVHFSDVHVQHELGADKGMTKALKAVESLSPKPDFIMTGGDLVYDAFEQNEQRARMLFDLFNKVASDNTGLTMHHCIGNHDVFGWSQKNGILPEHALYGKKMWSQEMQMPHSHYSFDHKGWRIYVLDTIQPGPKNSYLGYLEKEQMEWLEGDLKAKPAAMPAIVVSHIPLLTVTIIRDKPPAFEHDQYQLPIGGICRDAGKLTQLLPAHNVRLALSGHIHEIDRIDFRGTTYICDGAVCGSWWKGPNNGFKEGFGVLDMKADGTFEHHYHEYGWTAQKA